MIHALFLLLNFGMLLSIAGASGQSIRVWTILAGIGCAIFMFTRSSK